MQKYRGHKAEDEDEMTLRKRGVVRVITRAREMWVREMLHML
jgi:hypothetical protein